MSHNIHVSSLTGMPIAPSTLATCPRLSNVGKSSSPLGSEFSGGNTSYNDTSSLRNRNKSK